LELFGLSEAISELFDLSEQGVNKMLQQPIVIRGYNLHDNMIIRGQKLHRNINIRG